MKTNNKESISSPNMDETMALTINILFFICFIIISVFELINEPNRYAIKLARQVLGVDPNMVLNAMLFVNQLGDGSIIARLKTSIMNIFIMKPNIITFLALL